ncbi:DUF533 domain-containing protein [Pseudomonas sp. QL9]|uniref:DUF533 domain-containing protein n=1 Tax=Pseudomonas sp. QL9 TaxID=3242725 RepID=UPI00352AE889
MNTTDLLEQLLQAGQGSMAQQGGGGGGMGGLGGLLGGLLGGASGGGGSSGGLGGLGDVLGSVLGGGGSPQGRSSGGGTNYAMLASLGMMAFQAYQSWQRQQQSAAPQQAPRTVDQLSGDDAEAHSHAILIALIAAAKADGRIDDKEKQAIYAEINRHAGEPELQSWLDQEVQKPLDAADVAQAAQGEAGLAAEMYLASVMLVDDQQDAERNYLDELAYQLGLDPTLQAHLEDQAKGGA